ncbi:MULTISPECIES: hypothetical protein [unclassified Pseudoalteromonas]|uniref:hypothetical protein n=1 Tax=unclassified Pseudoalteromonas TaxID=194690 RepID=UPI0018F881C0|nr:MULTISPECIES: hypothetical protein [unclassified Pseudoalteromonas]MBS3797524.1 hypothetical protein [Pseudoalteromonas sp. BDTF-M6]
MKKLALMAVLSALAGCSASTQFEALQNDVTLSIDTNSSFVVDADEQHTFSTTSFGQYEFKAEQKGKEPFYGILPLKFNGGYLAADIIFFAPAMFFNLREVFPYYQFDIENSVLRYKKDAEGPWILYKPKQSEMHRAKEFFENSAP